MAEAKSGERAPGPPGLPRAAGHTTGSPARAESLGPAMPSWARVFPGTPQQVGAARRFVAALLDGSPYRDDAVLVVSELVTNALLHSRSGNPGGLVAVQVTRWRLGVRIAVTDQGSPNSPVVRDAGPGCEVAECGHGLYMVCHLAEHLDWHDDASGRTIHAILGQHPPGHCRHQPDSQPTGPALAQA
jgi:anti-sigma regulatory factor (Ser/Thr protein kinase)